MPARGINFTFYLMDGEPDGKIKVTNTSWNGVVYKIPREKLPQCRDFDAFKQSGVYFLFGDQKVYVGQAEVRRNGNAVYQRVIEHTTDRYQNDWNEVVVFTGKDATTLGRTDVSFLENYFFQKALSSGSFTVLNNNTPSPGTVSEEKKSELESFADYVDMIVGILGYKVFEPCISNNSHTTLCEETQTVSIPPLPDLSTPIGQFVYTALVNLGTSGYTFSDSEIDTMCTSEWSKETFHTKYPFMRRFVPGITNNKGIDGHVRYKAEPFTFGDVQVLVTKEWFERQRNYFITWYNSLHA